MSAGKIVKQLTCVEQCGVYLGQIHGDKARWTEFWGRGGYGLVARHTGNKNRSNNNHRCKSDFHFRAQQSLAPLQSNIKQAVGEVIQGLQKKAHRREKCRYKDWMASNRWVPHLLWCCIPNSPQVSIIIVYLAMPYTHPFPGRSEKHGGKLELI